jgi:uncharacterized membrane protein
MVLPAGTTFPPLPYAAALLAAALVVGWRLRLAGPAVDDRTALAFAPWMVAGAAGYVCYQLGVVPASLAPLASSPTVYLTTFVVAGAVWLAARRLRERPTVHLALAGLLAALVPVGAALRYGVASGGLALAWPLGGALGALALGAAARRALVAVRPRAAITGWTGALAVFGHTLDGVTTAVGVDVLGFGERTPLSRLIIEFGAELPTAPYLGDAWLFVVVKVLLAAGIVSLFADYVEAEPTEGHLLLTFVAAVGLGPGAHNVVLFAAAG